MQINNLKQSRAELLCPYKIGDIITNRRGGTQAKISRIVPGYGRYEMFGYFLRKDGTPGTKSHRLYSFEW